MPIAMMPPEYRAYFLGSATSLEGLSAFTPLEEGVAEGTLVLMRLDFEEYPSTEALTGLNAQLLANGVPSWPGYAYIVFADTTEPTIYLAWTKGIAWLPVILGILGATLLPPLLMAAIWWILPEPITQVIEGMFAFGLMFLVTWLMMKIVPALMPAEEKPKEIEETK